MGHLIRMERKPPDPSLEEEVGEKVDEVTSLLSSYLSDFLPKRMGYTKHAIMGPVGKLLSAMGAEKFATVDGYVGYTVNVHRNVGTMEPKTEQVENLRKAVKILLELKGKVDPARWSKILSEVDYGVYYNSWVRIQERIAEKKKRKGGEGAEGGVSPSSEAEGGE